MMKKIIFTIGVLSSCAAYSQVGINTETPKATLEVTGKPSDLTEADGIIAPRLKGSELKTKDALYTADQKSALVYVTEALSSADTTSKTVNVTSIGYFYFDGNVWQKLNAGNAGAGGNDWALLGNSGTTAGTNFIGTTDSQDFVVKTNNTEKERTLSTVNSNNVIKTITGGDLIVNKVIVGKGSGNRAENTVVGTEALAANTIGRRNTGLGNRVLTANTTGNNNVSVGNLSLEANTEGNSNVAIGQSALIYNTTGSGNIAIGHNTLHNTLNKTGKNNIAIGFRTGDKLEDGAENNIVIGADQDLASNTANNQLNIGGAIFGTGLIGTEAAPAGNIGIGKIPSVSGAKLDVAGSINGGKDFVGSIGTNSIAVGDSLSVGGMSAAFGRGNKATGALSMSWGTNNIASSLRSTAFGGENQSTGFAATTFGARNTASNAQTTAFGADNIASGQWATAFGQRNKASNNNATVFGTDNIASGINSLAFGQNNVANSAFETVFGRFAAITSGNDSSWLATDPLLQIGNGGSETNRSNALTVLKNGNIGIGETAPTRKLEINNGTTNGAIKIVDGTQGTGKVLTSDSNGVGTWQSPTTQSGNNWSLLGNSGTTAGTNFIGTTDSQDFVIKTNNTERERTYAAVNSNNEIKKIMGGDLNLNTITVGRGKGNLVSNTVLGHNSLIVNSTGDNNTTVGSYALQDNTTGKSNTVLGSYALNDNTEGDSNVAVGVRALLSNETGKQNIAIGESALSNPLNNKSGNNNIAIGYKSGANLADGTSNNIVIGSQQGYATATASNQLNIGGAIFGTGLTGTEAAPAGNIGIGTTNPTTRLEVNNGTTSGAIKIVDGTQGNGKVLMSDANGVGTWQTPASIRPTILGVFPTSDILVQSDGGAAPKYSEVYIDLSPGRWIVNSGTTIYVGVANTRYIEHLYLSSSQTSVTQVGFTHLGPAGNNVTVADVISSGSDVNDSNLTQNFVAGSTVINVTVPTRIYLLLQNKGTNYWSFPTRAWENYLYAIPVN